ncbi:hypothetical protein [Microbacterium sp. YY-01]|uniref:hypothetical protein n=1 Tax=Microbacterium sp. YY-01 TaxID=3421634 RepID=UPI003D18550D
MDGAGGGGASGGEKTFTQAELDQIVSSRLAKQEREKFGDYADLKAKAEGAKTVEQQLADLTAKHEAAELRALQSDVATRYKVSAEDRDLFMTGTDKATLEAQAKRLSERAHEKRRSGDVAPLEGAPSNTGSGDDKMREFTRQLFNRQD